MPNNVQLIQMQHRWGHEIAPLPETIQPYINTTLAWDRIDRLEKTLFGAETSHRVDGIAVQARHFGPNRTSTT